jgi:hypothetical protein
VVPNSLSFRQVTLLLSFQTLDNLLNPCPTHGCVNLTQHNRKMSFL